MRNLKEYLSANTYPGRGILFGKACNGEAVAAYFIMGRSENSRNRIFVADGDGIRTEAKDPTKLTDPSLIIYAPVRVLGNNLIVTNGDQTDTIYSFMSEGKSFVEALETRCYEPDEPNYTPRISGLMTIGDTDFSYKLSILKRSNGICERLCYDFTPKAGVGHIIHTYDGDGNPIPSFSGEPVEVDIENGIEALTSALWTNLNEDNRVSLFVRYIGLRTGMTETKIINRF